MASLDPSAIGDKWLRAMQQAGTAMTAGANAVTEAPGEKAAAAADRWLSGVQEAHSTGKFASNSRAVSLQQWRDAYIKKGIPAVSAGATFAKPAVVQFHAQAGPIYRASSAQVKAMPKGTEADSIARFITNMNNMKTIKFRRGS